MLNLLADKKRVDFEITKKEPKQIFSSRSNKLTNKHKVFEVKIENG